jgi:hypothetical protein
MPRSSKWSLPSGSPPNFECTSPLLHTCHMPHPSLSSWFDHPSDICWGVQIIKLCVM